MALAVSRIVGDALTALNVYQAGEAVSADDAALVLSQLNTLFDDWAAEGQSSWAAVFTTFTTTPSLQPHTIGPTGTWVLPVRPAKIDGARLVSASGVSSVITVHDDPQWWLSQTPIASTSPTDAYYAPDVPNGSLYFVGAPSSAVSIEIMTRGALAQVLLTQSIDLPPGYRQAITLTLMEAIAEPFGRPMPATLERRAGQARGRIWANNLVVPTLRPMAGGWFDYRDMQWK